MLAVALLASTVLAPAPVLAETLFGAMQKAYHNNASLNSSRAGLRATDEDVAIAKSGYRPNINGTYKYGRSRDGLRDLYSTSGEVGIQLNQSLFDGFQTKNNVAAAESRVFAQRENLRNDEQNRLFDAVSAYMDVYQNREIAALRRKNLAALNEQVRAAKARLDVGEGTRTDVAQADARRSAAIAQLNAALANVKSAEAVYQQVIGSAPDKLQAARPAGKSLPKSIAQAYAIAENTHPGIKATQYAMDAAGHNVQAKQGALLPQVSAVASASHSTVYSGLPMAGNGNSASIGLNVTVPIYSGGRNSATVRKSKEELGKARIEVDVIRDKVRAAVGSSWSQLEAARASVVAYRDGISAARLALDGVIEERNVGQRTTLDVLNAQNDLINAQILLVEAERDVVVASYAVLNAVGRLTAKQIGLQVAEYKPEQHYDAVKDKWIGLRTPDGR
ncbi:TolC family outer membrane protein [Pseudochrobactrum sp. HB0163]|uniref:TolC family outer membrane protein n=1 Tax=Pseudochrobactrum sp. HB0163 TaxID=3450708 RepID=UPI003F6E1887